MTYKEKEYNKKARELKVMLIKLMNEGEITKGNYERKLKAIRECEFLYR